MTLFYQLMESPVGQLRLVANKQALVALLWDNENPKWIQSAQLVEQPQHPVLLATVQQLQEYFQGKRLEFHLPLDFTGTEFQQRVWQALLDIPFGHTRSYKDIALQIGRPKAMRAVGAANGKNPISIIAPCHRVIGANGTLVGFAGGLDKKQILLDLEQSVIQQKS